jgi:hypothetical protein
VVASTKAGYAKYRLTMTDPEQQMLELQCVDAANFIGEDGTVRMYYMDLGVMVGASCGEETNLIYAEHDAMGHVHGRPIAAQELRQLGVQI